MPDDVKSPSHYTQGKIEVIDFIKDQKLDYCEGNVIKYICRYKHKCSPETDLRKARQYIDFLLEEYEQELAEDIDRMRELLSGDDRNRCNRCGAYTYQGFCPECSGSNRV